uniref:EGF-like domain-containing protein n=1 Tax=Glossina brevipalpis TaxID=37001 RepID=A0A1A9W6Q8_9MUSC
MSNNFIIVAPSLDTVALPLESTISLSIPRGPNVVRTASTIDWHALMFDINWDGLLVVELIEFNIATAALALAVGGGVIIVTSAACVYTISPVFSILQNRPNHLVHIMLPPNIRVSPNASHIPALSQDFGRLPFAPFLPYSRLVLLPFSHLALWRETPNSFVFALEGLPLASKHCGISLASTQIRRNLIFRCPPGHYGSECKPCNECEGNGKCKRDGAHKGNGRCACDAGYSGTNCNECGKGYNEAFRDSKNIQ